MAQVTLKTAHACHVRCTNVPHDPSCASAVIELNRGAPRQHRQPRHRPVHGASQPQRCHQQFTRYQAAPRDPQDIRPSRPSETASADQRRPTASVRGSVPQWQRSDRRRRCFPCDTRGPVVTITFHPAVNIQQCRRHGADDDRRDQPDSWWCDC